MIPEQLPLFTSVDTRRTYRQCPRCAAAVVEAQGWEDALNVHLVVRHSDYSFQVWKAQTYLGHAPMLEIAITEPTKADPGNPKLVMKDNRILHLVDGKVRAVRYRSENL